MLLPKKVLLIFIPVLLLLSYFLFNHFHIQRKIDMKILGANIYSAVPTPPQQININGRVMVKYPQDYTILMLGDSMTESLGNSDELRVYLKKYYPNKTFEILNYGYGSTNILSAQERLDKDTWHGRVFRPILDIDFDLILIESFGHNPLSEYTLEDGLIKQNQALDKIVSSIKSSNPKAVIVFVATIAPNSHKYGLSQVSLSSEQRVQWTKERVAYIQNHLQYAKSHQIPYIDIFQKSLDSQGDGNLDYISTNDYIHPSANGIFLISEEIAKSIYDQKILAP